MQNRKKQHRRTMLGGFAVCAVVGLTAERLIEGLRALPLDQFPVPISFNGVD